MVGADRIAVLSLHTSPLARPGGGDAGGMNVYVRALAREQAALGTAVDVFTRSQHDGQEPVEHPRAGVRVIHLDGAPADVVVKEAVPQRLAALEASLRQFTQRDGARYDVLHSHYWLSGAVGLRLQLDWQIPLVHSMHTMGLVKNLHLQPGEAPEPETRVRGEQAIASGAGRLIANTLTEACELADLYGADEGTVDVIPPGVDLRTFRPEGRQQDRAAAGLGPDTFHLVFAGRIQALKGPQVLLAAAAELRRQRPDIRLRISITGEASGAAELDLPALATQLGLDDVVALSPPVEPAELAATFRSADVVVVPSFSESFGLVALEAQACGTPVVATNVGGLPVAVSHGLTGLLVDGHDPARWAGALRELHDYPEFRRRLGVNAAVHASSFGWEQTAALTAHSYQLAVDHFRR
jgi:D-inositol-3-phosphate glycosyltransferase